MTEDKTEPSATVAQLRHAIDSGKTGDKIPSLDPAAAPLGTDAEAGGVRPEAKLLAEDANAQRRGGAHAHQDPWRLSVPDLALVSGITLAAWAAGASLALLSP